MDYSGLTIGKLARQANVNIETIRYYQRVGLIQEPTKPLDGYQRYLPETVACVCFIKRVMELGFTSKEISDPLMLEDGHCQEVRELVEHKQTLITLRIDDLQKMQRALEKLLKQCRLNQK